MLFQKDLLQPHNSESDETDLLKGDKPNVVENGDNIVRNGEGKNFDNEQLDKNVPPLPVHRENDAEVKSRDLKSVEDLS